MNRINSPIPSIPRIPVANASVNSITRYFTNIKAFTPLSDDYYSVDYSLQLQIGIARAVQSGQASLPAGTGVLNGAAGMEPLNPNLETAPPEATPANGLTLEPTYAAYLDDRVDFYFNTLPKGTYDFYFRTRAQISGEFVQPPARAEMMYDESVVGTSPGARIVIAPGRP